MAVLRYLPDGNRETAPSAKATASPRSPASQSHRATPTTNAFGRTRSRRQSDESSSWSARSPAAVRPAGRAWPSRDCARTAHSTPHSPTAAPSDRLRALDRVAASVAEVTANGRILLGADDEGGYDNASPLRVARLRQDGSLDRSFGRRGRLRIDVPHRPDAYVGSIQLDPVGRLVLIGTAGGGHQPSTVVVARVTRTGHLDRRFGHAGISVAPNGLARSLQAWNGTLLPEGRIVAVGSLMSHTSSDIHGYLELLARIVVFRSTARWTRPTGPADCAACASDRDQRRPRRRGRSNRRTHRRRIDEPRHPDIVRHRPRARPTRPVTQHCRDERHTTDRGSTLRPAPAPWSVAHFRASQHSRRRAAPAQPRCCCRVWLSGNRWKR